MITRVCQRTLKMGNYFILLYTFLKRLYNFLNYNTFEIFHLNLSFFFFFIFNEKWVITTSCFIDVSNIFMKKHLHSW